MSPEAIAQALKRDILQGRLPPNSELRQGVLAKRFGVSRIPIRDALRFLAADGLAAIVPGRGATVIALSTAELEEVYDLRVLLECDCLARAGHALDGEAFEEIDRIRRKAELDAGTPSWSEGDWAFHEAIYRFADRPRQLSLIRSLRQDCRVAVAGYEVLPQASARWLSDHSEIVAHLRAQDIQGAVAALRRHLEAARDHLLRNVALGDDTSC